MKISKSMKIVCICRGGQVRSVATRNILAEKYGFQKVLACGWEKNDQETVDMLCDWADAIIVVGSVHDWNVPASRFLQKSIFVNVGKDRWGHYGHPELHSLLTPLIASLLN